MWLCGRRCACWFVCNGLYVRVKCVCHGFSPAFSYSRGNVERRRRSHCARDVIYMFRLTVSLLLLLLADAAFPPIATSVHEPYVHTVHNTARHPASVGTLEKKFLRIAFMREIRLLKAASAATLPCHKVHTEGIRSRANTTYL